MTNRPTRTAHPVFHLLLALALVLTLGACGTDADAGAGGGSAADAATDGGASQDGGGSADAGSSSDSAEGADGGASADGSSASKTYAVGVTTIQAEGAGGRSLPVEVWYPIKPGTKGTATSYALGLLPSRYGAIRDAEPATDGPYPLIAFSHGNGGLRTQSAFLTEYLARHGYVVVSPDHVGNTAFDGATGGALAGVMVLWRPIDLRAAIDRVLTPKDGDPAWLKGLAKSDKVAVTGHSFGGYTALATAGVKVTIPPGYNVDCTKRPADDKLCVEMKSLGDPPWDLGDKRVVVAIPMAHALWGAGVLEHASIGDYKVPTVMLTASADKLTPPPVEAAPMYAKLTGPRALLTFQGGDHFAFADICPFADLPAVPASMKASIKQLCSANAKPPLETMYAIIQAHVRAAADVYLKGDESARAVFSGEKSGDGVFTFQAEGIAK